MAERTNRRDLIIQAASDLFMEQGYAATSVRQISDTVGCTEAALYYHFKNGKRALLQAVIEKKSPDFLSILDDCDQAETLAQFILKYIHNVCAHCREMERNIQWVVAEFSNLSDDEKSLFHAKHLMFHAELIKHLLPYVDDDNEAKDLAWLLICASFGYRQIFVTLGLENLADFSTDTFAEKMACYLAR